VQRFRERASTASGEKKNTAIDLPMGFGKKLQSALSGYQSGGQGKKWGSGGVGRGGGGMAGTWGHQRNKGRDQRENPTLAGLRKESLRLTGGRGKE